LAVSLHPPKKYVISTEGGALCRRSGEIPVFSFFLSLHTAARRRVKPQTIKTSANPAESHVL
jgi:hypothetical protein